MGIILKLILGTGLRECYLNLNDQRKIPLAAFSHGGAKTSGSTKIRNFLKHPNNYQQYYKDK
jgi:hypothetical protein